MSGDELLLCLVRVCSRPWPDLLKRASSYSSPVFKRYVYCSFSKGCALFRAMLAAGENVEVGDGRGSFKSRTVLEIGSFFHVSSSVQRLMRLLKYVYKITGLNTW